MATTEVSGEKQIKASGVSPAVYGDDTHVAQITLNSAGQVTSAVEVAISAAASNPGGANKDIQFNDSATFGGVAANVSTTRKFLMQDGDGGSAFTPSLEILVAGDVPATLNGVTVSQTFALSGDISPSQITTNVNNYNPTGLSTATVLRLYTDASRNITGLAGGADGRVLRIENYGSFDIVLKNQSASSTAANRFALISDLTIVPNTVVELQYDSTTSRWYALGISGGISPSDTVTDGTSFGETPAAGTSAQYSRGDHGHGTPDTSLVFPHSTDSVDATGQSADIASANFTVGTLQSIYRISYYLDVASADITAGAVILTFTWNDGVTGRTLSETPLVLTSTGYAKGSEVVFLNSGNLTYAVSHTGLFGTAVFDIHLRCEILG